MRDPVKNIIRTDSIEESKVNDITHSLYKRLMDETELLLKKQLAVLGVDLEKDASCIEKCRKRIFPDDELALAVYEYDGRPVLGLRISENRMSIEFDVPNLETQKMEVQNVQ